MSGALSVDKLPDPRNQLDQFLNRNWSALQPTFEHLCEQNLRVMSTDVLADAIAHHYTPLAVIVALQDNWKAWVDTHLMPALASVTEDGDAAAQRAYPDDIQKADDPLPPGIAKWLETSRKQAIEWFGEAQAQVVHQLVARAALENRWTPGSLARELRPAINLTPAQANKAYTQFFMELHSEVPLKQAGINLDARVLQMKQERAVNILQDQMSRAWNQGTLEGVKARVETGELDEATVKVWLTANDDRVCMICAPLHGKWLELHEDWPEVEDQSPPGHVKCRCAMAYRRRSSLKTDDNALRGESTSSQSDLLAPPNEGQGPHIPAINPPHARVRTIGDPDGVRTPQLQIKGAEGHAVPALIQAASNISTGLSIFNRRGASVAVMELGAALDEGVEGTFNFATRTIRLNPDVSEELIGAAARGYTNDENVAAYATLAHEMAHSASGAFAQVLDNHMYATAMEEGLAEWTGRKITNANMMAAWNANDVQALWNTYGRYPRETAVTQRIFDNLGGLPTIQRLFTEYDSAARFRHISQLVDDFMVLHLRQRGATNADISALMAMFRHEPLSYMEVLRDNTGLFLALSETHTPPQHALNVAEQLFLNYQQHRG